MSINGYHLLNKAIYDQSDISPTDILNRVADGLRKEYKNSNNDHKYEDDMDISLCVFDENNSRLQIAGAGLLLYI